MHHILKHQMKNLCMLDAHHHNDDGCDDLMKHEESFPHKTPSVQCFVVKVCLVFFQIFASAFTTENTLSEVLTSSGFSLNHRRWNGVTAAHKTQHNSFFYLMFAVLSLGSFYCNSLYQRQTAKALLLLKTQHLGFR